MLKKGSSSTGDWNVRCGGLSEINALVQFREGDFYIDFRHVQDRIARNDMTDLIIVYPN
jgi:hypothetical protein